MQSELREEAYRICEDEEVIGAMELICQLLKIKSIFDYLLTASIYGNSELSVFRIIGSMRRLVGCLVKAAYQ